MKTIAKVLVSAALMLAAAAPTQANDETRFGGLVRKYAPRYFDQYTSFAPKTVCICDPGGANAAGVMLSFGTEVGCLIPNFANGSLASFQPCVSYVVLGK
jgi:hypothetical protein